MARSSSSKRGSLYADLEHLRTLFSSLDPDNSGYIGHEELSRLAQSESGMDESMVPQLLESLDRDKDGRVSFEDLQALFELEREAAKRQKVEGKKTDHCPLGGLISPARVAEFSNSQEYDTALDTTPSELVASPTPSGDSIGIFQTPTVVLRHKRSLLLPTGGSPALSHGNDEGISMLSPKQAGGTPPRSPVEPDLATQMSYLTDIPMSPRLNQRSKVLSWISESEDMFEDTGASREHTDGLLSPPMSPVRGGGDEAAHVLSVLEGVCHTQDIGKDAVRKLCSHVQADPQEEQELLALLDHLDKEGKGHVGMEEFVHGLQSMRTSASVATSTPPSTILGPESNDRPHRHNEDPIPRLSEPFSSTPNSGFRTWSHHTSTPLLPPRKTAVYGDRPQLTVLDPNNSGFVRVEALAQQWQRMGVEPPHNQSLEDALRESLPMDASRCVSVSEVTTTLETAVLSDDRNQPTLRQAALLTFKGEINQLRNQLHQVSMERDGLRSNLQRTTEESKRLVQEGDEQVERITKQSERKAREDEVHLRERLREMEREKEEEAKRLQELADRQWEKLEKDIHKLKCSEERLKTELKLTQDEAKRRQRLERLECPGGGQGDRPDRMEVGQEDRVGMRVRLDELEQVNAELLEQSRNLREQNTGLQDRVDELSAENERMKQKYISHRRKLQRQRSEPNRLNSAPHSASGLDEDRRTSRPRSGKRPSSASRRSTTGIAPSSLAFIAEDIDTSSKLDSDPDTSSPVRSSELPGDTWRRGLQGGMGEEESKVMEAGQEGSDGTSSSDDGLFAKSTTSLMEEMQFGDNKANQERELEQLRRENQELEESCRLLEQQLQHQQDQSSCEQHRQLQARKRRQEELERRIRILEQQKKRLSNTKEEIDSQLANAEDSLVRQLDEIHRLRDMLSSTNVTPTDFSYVQTSLNHVHHESTEASAETELDLLEELERRESMEHSLDHQQLLKELQNEVDASRGAMNQMKTVHKEEMVRMKLEAGEERQKYLAYEDEQNKILMRLEKELRSSQLALEQYKHDALSLEDQLQKSRQIMKTKERELQLLQGRPQRKTLPLLPGQALDKEELMRLSEDNKKLQEDIRSMRAELEKVQEKELQKRESQLVQHEAELEEMRHDYLLKLAVAREDGENKAAAMRTLMEKELRMSKERCEIQVEGAQQELKVSQLTIMQLNGKLELAEKQCESLLHNVSQHRDTAAIQASLIVELEERQVRLQEELSHVQRDKQERDSQLVQQADKEQELYSQLGQLQSLLKQSQSRQAALAEEIAMEETDCPLEAIPLTSPTMSPSRRSFQSDHSFHEEIVTQMKSQLEDLQMCLVQQHSSPSKVNELTLVQELLGTNSALQANLEREQAERKRELVVLERKDLQIITLMEKMEEYHSELVNFKNAMLETFEQALKSLQQRSDASIHKSSSKLEAASMVILQLIETLRAREERHTSALETLISELNQSLIAQESYKEDMKQLHSTLDRSREELDHSEQELKRTLDIKESEVSELRRMLDKAHTNYCSLQAQTDSLEWSERLRVEATQRDSAINYEKQSSDVGLQVGKEGEEEERMGSERKGREIELKQKEKEMEALREEAKRAEQQRSETKSMVDAIRGNMQLKEEEMGYMEAQIHGKEHEIEELQRKLETIVNEPVEVVMQYMEAVPLESVSDAVFTSMEKDLQAGRRQNLQLEVQHREEVKKLKEELCKSVQESSELKQQVHALKQAVQEQEVELRAMLQNRETERREREMGDKQNQTRAQEQYSLKLDSAQSAAEAHKSQLRAVCSQLLILRPDTEEVDYTELAQRAQDRIATLYRQLSEEQGLRHEVEVAMTASQTEWEAQESQWLVEHEEEVRALRQRNCQLLQLLEDTRSQYQDFITEQERENSLLLQDLMNKQASLERDLELRTQELDRTSTQPQNTSQEREVLLGIMQQLCLEIQKPLNLDM